ncbi:MAG: hypothetical protein ACI4DK_11395 [Lachnospiraceae bacterium]
MAKEVLWNLITVAEHWKYHQYQKFHGVIQEDVGSNHKSKEKRRLGACKHAEFQSFAKQNPQKTAILT